MGQPRASNSQVLLYALPAMAIAFINLPCAIVPPACYAEHNAATRWNFPIDARRHTNICKGLEQLASRAKVVQA